jgi:iron(III) transport system permease protein
LLIFIVYPLFTILKRSFLTADNKITFQSYISNLRDPQVIGPLKNTLLLGTLVGAFSTIIGFIFAYANAYIKTPFKKLFNIISILPIVSPPFVLCLSLIMLFGNRGFISYFILHIHNSNIYGLKGLILVQTMTFFPVAYLLLVGLLKQIDPSLEEASRNLGASSWETFVKIILPLMAPGLANAFLLTFIETVADFSNPMVIGGNFSTLATQIYMQATASYDMQGAAVVAVILLSMSMLLFIFEKYWLEKKTYVTMKGKASRERSLIRNKKAVYPFNIFCICISAFIGMLYILIPFGALFKTWGEDYTLTLNNYRAVFEIGRSAIIDTSVLSAIATVFTGFLAMIIAFLIVRKKFFGRGFIEFTSMLAMAVPGTVIGIGYILAFNDKPFYLTGTAAIIIIVFIVRSLPVGVRSGITTLKQIDPSIEEAAADLGADTKKVFTSITLPLVKSSFFSGLVYSFVRSMTAVSAVIFLVSPKYNLITIGIMGQTDRGRFGIASAYSTILILIVASAIFIMNLTLEKFGSKREAL